MSDEESYGQSTLLLELQSAQQVPELERTSIFATASLNVLLSNRSYRVAGVVGVVGVLLFNALFLGRAKSEGRGSDISALEAIELNSDVDAPTFGTVRGIYTYGSPATARPALVNLQRSDGCFAGLRTWCEDVLTPITKQEDAAAISNQFLHAQVASAALHLGSDSTYVPCPGNDEQPFSRGEEFADWRLHWEDDYTPRLKDITIDGEATVNKAPFRQAYQNVLLAYKSYDSTTNARAQIAERLGSNWRVVERQTLIQGFLTLYDEDPVMLIQDSKSLDCALVFAGVNNYGNEIATATAISPVDFCGFSNVHMGYRDELMRIATALLPILKPKLSQCAKVDCVGHSMGGSLCELFAACVNSNRVVDADFVRMSWLKGTPAVIPEVTAGGSVFAPNAEHRCDEPPCPK